MKKLLVSALFLLAATWASAQSPVGTWVNVDDKTGEAKSHIQVFESNGKLYGKIIKLLIQPANTLCTKCSGDKKNQPMVGMVILSDLALKNGFYQGGNILDPKKGDYYKCSIWLQGDNANVLNVKGIHWSGISRTQKWTRIQ